MKIILLNGPPRCGKDTIAEILKNHCSSEVHIEKFALPLKLAVPLIYGITVSEWKEDLDTEQGKDYRCDQFFGISPRDVQIALSEDFLKPLHGKDIFGKLLVRRLERILGRGFSAAVVSDSGFREEAEVIVNKFGADNVQLWRIHRDGCDFKKDSQGYIHLADIGVDEFDIDNCGTMKDLIKFTVGLYKAAVIPRELVKVGNERELEPMEQWIARYKAAAKGAIDNATRDVERDDETETNMASQGTG